MTKLILNALLITPLILIFTGCVAPGSQGDRKVLPVLKQVNRDLNKKVEELQNEIKMLKNSEKVDVPKAELMLKISDLKKKYDKIAITLQKSNQKMQQVQKGHDSLEFELLDAKNEMVVLMKSNAELYSLVTKLSEKIKVITNVSLPVSETIPSEKNRKAADSPQDNKEIPKKNDTKEPSPASETKKTEP